MIKSENNFSVKSVGGISLDKVDLSDIEGISKKAEEKKSLGTGKKFSLLVFLSVTFIFITCFFGIENFNNLGGFGANILEQNISKDGSVLHGSFIATEGFSDLSLNYLKKTYWFLVILFFTIYTLYVFAKMELQRLGEHNGSQKDFATRNFPSIYILETMTMLYVIIFVILSFFLIQKIDFETAFNTLNSSLRTVANFSLFGGALSSLFFFLHKVRPGKIDENGDEGVSKRMNFDVNRVLKYLSFPFMSAGMGVVSYLIVMGSGDVLGIQFLQEPSNYFIILLAVMAGYFCDAFVMFFHSIFKSIELKLHKQISK